MRSLLSAVMTCRRGATAVEYGLIVSLIVIAMVASLSTLANTTVAMWDMVANKVTNAG